MAKKVFKYPLLKRVWPNEKSRSGYPSGLEKDGGIIISQMTDSVHFDYEVKFDDSTTCRYKEEELDDVKNTHEFSNVKDINEFDTANKDVVNQPDHYTHGGIETLSYMKAKMTKEAFEGFLAGNVIKYISRYEYKNGLEDLKKAKVYLDKLIKEKEVSN